MIRVNREMRRALRTRALRRDDGVAMMSAILLIVMLSGLSVLILALVVSQIMPTQFARKNTRTIYAAEAGIEASLGEIRSALGPMDFTQTVYGSPSLLPCTLQGTVADPAGELAYSATIRYYRDNPAGQPESWLQSKKLNCTPGAGVVLQPLYAHITSTGGAEGGPALSADDAERTMTTIYRFNTTSTNVAGGRIYTFTSQHCLRADGQTAGSRITYAAVATCGNDDDSELWLYSDTYQIKLAATTLPGATPMCITGEPPSMTSGTVDATLQECKSKTDSGRWSQLWSWEGGSRWKGQNSTISAGYSEFCLFSGDDDNALVTNKKLRVGYRQCASDQDWGSFNPDAAVGAGAASADTRQVVNFLEFGRCFDVTGEDVTREFMIVYPCKQDPSGGSQLKWNHKWYYNEPANRQGSAAPQQIKVYFNNIQNSSNDYCLLAPPAGGTYVKLEPNCSASAANQRWTRYADTGNYGTSWTFVDHLGRCIGIGDKFNSAWSKMVVSSCTGGLDQKWNAPPESAKASVGNYLESAGG